MVWFSNIRKALKRYSAKKKIYNIYGLTICDSGQWALCRAQNEAANYSTPAVSHKFKEIIMSSDFIRLWVDEMKQPLLNRNKAVFYLHMVDLQRLIEGG